MLFAILAITAFVGWPFYPYFLLRQIVFYLWDGRAITKTTRLFVVANIIAVFCAGLTYLASLLIIPIRSPTFFSILAPVVFLAFGSVGWAALFIFYRGNRSRFNANFERQTLARFHVWLQDIFVAVFAFAISMTLWMKYLEPDPVATGILAVVELLNHLIAFVVTLESFRVFPLVSNGRKRLIALIVAMALCEIPGYSMFYFAAWVACRNALSKTEKADVTPGEV